MFKGIVFILYDNGIRNQWKKGIIKQENLSQASLWQSNIDLPIKSLIPYVAWLLKDAYCNFESILKCAKAY